MHNSEHIESVYRLANTITTFVQSLYLEGKYSTMYKDMYNCTPIELKSMPEYFPFVYSTSLNFGTYELLRNVILSHSEYGPKITTLQELYSVGNGYPIEQLHVLSLVELGFIKLAQIDPLQRPNELYLHILNKDDFIQAYKTALIKHQLVCHCYKDYNCDIVHLSSRILDYMSSIGYLQKDRYKEIINYCMDKVHTYWTSKSNKYLGAGDAELFFPFMTEVERRLLLLVQYKTKTSKKNKDIDYTFSLRELDPHKQIEEKHRAILSLLQMGFITCVNKINGEKWYFDIDTKFKVIDVDTLISTIYPTWFTKYICTVVSHVDKFEKS